eukprot:scaffold34477_cov40-Attheya_sp.AAC.2
MTEPPPASRSATRSAPLCSFFSLRAKKPRINDLTAERTAKAVAFLDAIMTNLAPSQHQEIHGVMKSVPDPFSGVARNVIIRESDLAFWNQLLSRLAAPNSRKRVTAE